MNWKSAVMGVVAVAMAAAGWSARGESATVPVQDLKLVQEKGKVVDENAVDEDDQAQGDNPEGLAYYYRPYRPYHGYRYYRTYGYYRPYYGYRYYRPYYGYRYYRPYYGYRYYRPYYGYPYGNGGEANLDNLPAPQTDQAPQAEQPQQ